MSTSKSSSEQPAQQADAAAEAGDQARSELPSYEQARDELVEVVRRLEAGGTTLEESLSLWERGEELARICESWLRGARERLDRAERTDQHEPDDEPRGR